MSNRMTDRWNTILKEDGMLEVTPKMEEMMKFVHEASCRLMENIMEREERLVLSTISNAGLKRMIMLCNLELDKRSNSGVGRFATTLTKKKRMKK